MKKIILVVLAALLPSGLVGGAEQTRLRAKLKSFSEVPTNVTSGTGTFSATVSGDDDDVTVFSAKLSGFGEVPPILADGRATFVGKLSADGNSIAWTLKWTGLTNPALVAHIHFGPPQNTGTPVVFFCGGPRPACPDGLNHSGSITGTWTAADVVAVSSQGVAAGNFTGFLRILRAHLGYANIHTSTHPGGEIRGQIQVRAEDEHDE